MTPPVLSQCPDLLDVPVEEGQSSSVSSVDPSNPSVTKLTDGSSCSTEAGTSEEEESEEDDRKLVQSISSSTTVIAKSSRWINGRLQMKSVETKHSVNSKHPSWLSKRRLSSSDSISATSVTRKPASQHSEVTTGRKAESSFVRPTSSSSTRKCKTSMSTRLDVSKSQTAHRMRTGSKSKKIELSSGETIPETLSAENNRTFSRSETLILFDWDDTLLPSSWLSERQLTLDPSCNPSEQEQAYLDAIANTVCSLLVAAVHCGRVVVVTNAESGWVDLSAAKFMPTVLETLNLWHISVISARSEFESVHLQHPVQWKVEAFRHLLLLAYPMDSENDRSKIRRRIDNRSRRNVVSFGDSDSERIALIRCVKSEPGQNSLYKSLKLCEHPTPTILQRQLQLVQRLMPMIIHHSGNLDLRVNFKLTTTAKMNNNKIAFKEL